MKELLIKIYKDFFVGEMGENKAEVLKETSSRIKKQYWLSSGTALGMFRDNDFTEGDTDIDYGMIGFPGIRCYLMDLFSDCELIQDVFYNGKLQQISFIKDGIIFEFIIYWLDGGEYVQVSTHGRQTMPRKVFEELETVECKYGSFPIPKDHETYFTKKIGDDWRTPRKSRMQYGQI